MTDANFIRLALRLALRGFGTTSPNPMVGAILAKNDKIIGRGWHRRAGEPHAEIMAIRDAERCGGSLRGATLYVTLEPCSTEGRTPPCTDAIVAAGIRRVVAGISDPNPRHAGRAFRILRRAGVQVVCLADLMRCPTTGDNRVRAAGRSGPAAGVVLECQELNESFNHWIVHRTPFVTVKSAMTIDGKIATATGESKWITGTAARAFGMKLRQGADAVLVGINTVLADDPKLSFRTPGRPGSLEQELPLRRIILDSLARTPLAANVLRGPNSHSTTIIVISPNAPRKRIEALAARAKVLVAPVARTEDARKGSRRSQRIDLPWLLRKLGAEEITSLLVEGGGEVNAAFLSERLAHRIAFFYAAKVLGGRESRPATGGEGAGDLAQILDLRCLRWRRIGADLLLTARVEYAKARAGANARR